MGVKECSLTEENCQVVESDLGKNNQQGLISFSQEMDSQHDTMNVQFNCPGNDPFETKNKFLNKWKNSASCKFAVGIFGTVNTKDFIPYTL